jgi:transposase
VIGLPAGVKVFLACGRTDMRKGMDGLAMQVQAVLRQDPFSGQVFCFRGRRGDLIKALYWDTQGLCLFAKRLEKGRFIWPVAGGRRGTADGGAAVDAAGRHRLAGAPADLAAGSGGLRRDRLTQGVWPR